MTETAVVPLCLLRLDFVTGFVVICCFLHNRLKKWSRMNGISLKVGVGFVAGFCVLFFGFGFFSCLGFGFF